MINPGFNWFSIIFVGVFGSLALVHFVFTYLENSGKELKNKKDFDKLKHDLTVAIDKGPSLYELHLANGETAEYVQNYEIAMYRGGGQEYFFDLAWAKNFLAEYNADQEYWRYTVILPSVMFNSYLKRTSQLRTRNLGPIQTSSVVRVSPKKYKPAKSNT